MRELPLTQGKVALVDDDIYEWASAFKWYAYRQRNVFYAARSAKDPATGRHMRRRLHREVLRAPPDLQVDHVDGDGLNNLRSNLRLATNSQNQQGFQPKRSGASSKFRGVFWERHARQWRVQIRKNGKLVHVGLFRDEDQAARAYDRAARDFFGEFASPNFPA